MKNFPLINQIFIRSTLGAPLAQPKKLSGGFLHNVYAVKTDMGHFVIKLLNPQIMTRPEAFGNFQRADAYEALLEKKTIPACTALILNDSRMQCLDGQYYYIYPWCDGTAIFPDTLTPLQAQRMGALCAQVHAAAQLPDGFHTEPFNFTFSDTELTDIARQAQTARRHLPSLSTLCHNDLDCKNVLWHKDKPILIDLECLGMGSPYLELMESALCFSGYDRLSLRPELLEAYLCGYHDAAEIPLQGINWATIFDARTDRLGWLEYCLSSGNTAEAEQTLKIIRYAETIREAAIALFSKILA